jgi:glycosyltransferase involved in cell wall biosynthesis
MINRLEPDYKNTPGVNVRRRAYSSGATVASVMDVSIITPYYNTDEVFLETVNSVLAQTLQNWEWIIVDDGSSDAMSIERLRTAAAKYNRIKIVHQNNAGPGAARNTAFANAKGRYICLLDSDDIIDTTYLEKCAWFLDSNQQYAFCNSYSVVFGDQEYLWNTGFERGHKYLQANSGPPISVIRHAAYIDSGGFDESIRFGHEDWDFWLAMAKAGHWGHTIPEYLQWYRKRSGGRFEQIMRSGDVNSEFEKNIRVKYAGLDKSFPTPERHFASAYETINTKASVSNSLEVNDQGRRILLLVPWMVTGGADRVNLDLLEGLSVRGHDVTVCATLSSDNCWEYQFARFTSDIFALPIFLRASDYPRFLTYLMASRKIDTVVITGSTIGYQFLPYLRSMYPGVAFVDMCHVDEAWQNGGHPRFGVGYQDALDLNIVTTKPLAAWMHARGADIARVKVMHTGVRMLQDSQLRADRCVVRSEFDVLESVPIIIFAGRLCEQKRPRLLAEILNGLNCSGLEFFALIIGDGEQRELLEASLVKFNLTEKVRLLGSVSHSRWLALLAGADILLMPSQYEGISVALLEAMAAGVVPVVANVGGQEDVVSSNVGSLISPGDNELEAYQDAVRLLFSNPATMKLMAVQCREVIAKSFSWDGMVDEFVLLLDEAHRLNVELPRNSISTALALEVATQALECKRLSDALESAWYLGGGGAINKSGPGVRGTAFKVFMRMIVVLDSTRLGKLLISNKALKGVVKKILTVFLGRR